MSPIRVQPTPTAQATPAPLPLEAAAKKWAEAQDFSGEAIRAFAFPKTDAATLPKAVRRAHQLYSEWEHADLGSARIYKVTVSGHPLWVLHTTTDGDDGFLELYNAQGKALATGVTGTAQPSVTWDTTLFAVRSHVTPWDSEPSIQAFTARVAEGVNPSSASGQALTTKELREAAAPLLGEELSSRSVDPFESAFLHRLLADQSQTLTPTARKFGEALGGLYALPRTSGRVVSPKSQSLRHVLGVQSAWTKQARWATAQDKKGSVPVRLDRLATFAQRALGGLPTQVSPTTSRDAQAVVRQAGASAQEAHDAVVRLAFEGGELFVGRLFTQGEDWVPRAVGRILFAVSPDGRAMRALLLSEKPVLTASELAKLEVAKLTGVNQDVEVVGDTQVPQGRELALVYRPPMGGTLRAKLTVLSAPPPEGPSSLLTLEALPPVLEPGLRAQLQTTVSTALNQPVDVLGWVGRDGPSGPGFVVAHKKPGTLGPVSLSTVGYSPTGSTVTKRNVGPNEEPLARDLALSLLRAHAEKMLEADPQVSDAAKLEVALKTRWRDAASLDVPFPDDPGPGFDPANARFVFKLSSVWGDNAVFVYFGKNGKHEVVDIN